MTSNFNLGSLLKKKKNTVEARFCYYYFNLNIYYGYAERVEFKKKEKEHLGWATVVGGTFRW